MPRTRAAPVQAAGRAVTGAGVAAGVGGAAAWCLIRSQLAAERITVPESARWLAGRPVKGPISALAQADAIARTAEKATGGKAYGELAADDPLAEMAMNAALLRSSLFTSVIAFGVAGAVAGMGGVLVLIGTALSRMAADEGRT